MSYYVKCVDEEFQSQKEAIKAVKQYKDQCFKEFSNAEMVVNGLIKRWSEIKILAQVQQHFDTLQSYISQILIIAVQNIEKEEDSARSEETKEMFQRIVNTEANQAIENVCRLTGAYDDDFEFDWLLEDLKDPINSMRVIAEDLIKFIRTE